MANISNAQIKAALKSTGGIYAFAAERLGVSRQNVQQRVTKSPELLAFKAEVEATMVDQAEAVALSALQEKQPNSTKPTKEAVRVSLWMLDRKGRDRGYTTRTELSNPDGSALQNGPVEITVNYIGSKPATETEEEVI